MQLMTNNSTMQNWLQFFYNIHSNPVDYRICRGLMQEHVYKIFVEDVSQLKQRLIDSWSSLSQDVIDDSIEQRQVRLRACVKAKGRHFEHLLH